MNSGPVNCLPRFIRDLLGSCPPAGGGVHSWLFRCARALHYYYRDKSEMGELLAAAAAGCGRSVDGREISQAIANSQSCAWQPGSSYRPSQRIRRWPSRAPEQIDAVTSAPHAPGLVDLWEMSPVRFDTGEPQTEAVIDALFPKDALLCCARVKERPKNLPREAWRGRLAKLQHIVPRKNLKSNFGIGTNFTHLLGISKANSLCYRFSMQESHPGLSEESCLGSFGIYREREREESVCLATCHAAGGTFFRYGSSEGIFSIEMPEDFHVRVANRSWTGQRVEFSGAGWRMAEELRVTLPGPLIEVGDTVLHLRWQPASAAREIVFPDGSRTPAHFDIPMKGTRVCGVRCDGGDVILASLAPIRLIRTTSYRHWKIQFDHDDPRLFVVPLLAGDSIEQLFERTDLLLDLLAHPPLECREEFSPVEGGIRSTESFPGSDWAPIPPFLSLATTGTRNLISLPTSDYLCGSLFGPMNFVRGSSWSGTIVDGWMKARISFSRPSCTSLPEYPEEMVYAGDLTWDPDSCNDRLLTLRTWAPLVGAHTSGPDREELVSLLKVPSAEEFRSSILPIQEPVLGAKWARPKDLWAERGDCAYDPDWYSGLMLSGLARAVECVDPRISVPAAQLARDVREERALLAEYFSLYHDWMFCSAVSDPRGGLWLPDCSHNGMEGLLGEANLRQREGDLPGALFLRGLAAKSGCAYMAAPEWADWIAARAPRILAQPGCGPFTFLRSRPDARNFGINLVALPHAIYPCTPSSPNPYLLAGHAPEYAALFRHHGPLDKLRNLFRIWETEFPERYTDWVEFYLGSDWRERFERDGDQEARIQAAVFYHLAPEISFRKWVLEESPDTVERRYAQPLNRAERLLLTADSHLKFPD